MRLFRKTDDDPSPKLVSMAILRDDENIIYNTPSIGDLRKPRRYSLCSDTPYSMQNDLPDDHLPSLDITDDEEDWGDNGSYTRSLDFDRSSIQSDSYYRPPATVSSFSSFLSKSSLGTANSRYKKPCCYTAVPAMVVEDAPHYGSTSSLHLSMKRGFSTWGKKMGRKLEQLTRGDSKENISFPLGSTRSRKRYWKPHKKSETFECRDRSDRSDKSDKDKPIRKAKIDRVESIRNLFKRSRSWDSSKDLEDEGSHHDMPSLSATISSDELNTKLEDEISNLADKIDQINNTQRSPLLRSVSASHLHIEENALSSSIFNETETKDQTETTKKAQFPYAFLRSKLTAVSEEMSMQNREECADSGRGTESTCGSIFDVRASFSENSDKSSCSDSLDGKPIKEESNKTNTSIPAPTGFADSQYVVKVQVEGLNSKKPKSSQIPTISKSRKLHKKPTEKTQIIHSSSSDTETGKSSERKDHKRTKDNTQRSRLKSRNSRSEVTISCKVNTDEHNGKISPGDKLTHRFGFKGNSVSPVRSKPSRSSSLERSITSARHWIDENDLVCLRTEPNHVSLRRAPSLPKPLAPLPNVSLSQKRFRLVRLVKEKSENLGLFISGKQGEGYTISHIVLGGLTYRDGRLREGDEIVNVNGCTLRTLEVQQAQSLLRNSPNEVDIVVARDPDSLDEDSLFSSRLSSNHNSETEDEPDSLNDWYYRSKSEGSNRFGRLDSSCLRSHSLEPTISSSTLDLSRDNFSSGIKSTSHLVKHSSLLFKDKELEYPSRSWSSALEDGKNTEYSEQPTRRVLPGIGRYEKSDQSAIPSSTNYGSKRSSRALASSRLARPSCISTLPRRPKSLNLSFHVAVFEKGPGQKNLGFSIVGGIGTPQGDMGIFVKKICPEGQASEQESLRVGDEILSINGESTTNMTHAQAIGSFRKVKFGKILLYIGRRAHSSRDCSKAKSFDALDKCTN